MPWWVRAGLPSSYQMFFAVPAKATVPEKVRGAGAPGVVGMRAVAGRPGDVDRHLRRAGGADDHRVQGDGVAAHDAALRARRGRTAEGREGDRRQEPPNQRRAHQNHGHRAAGGVPVPTPGADGGNEGLLGAEDWVWLGSVAHD